MTKPPAHRWDAASYDRSFEFVARGGESLLDDLHPQPGERIVDLGCGTGTLSDAIQRRGAHVIAFDADPAMVDAARRKYPELTVQQADARTFTVDPPVDAVFSNAVLHWIPEQDAVMARVFDALRPGGRFVAEMGGRGNIATIVAALRDAIDTEAPDLATDVAPWVYPSPAEQAARLERHGFVVRALHYFDRPSPLDGGEDGLRGWLSMFRSGLLEGAGDRAEAIVQRVEAATRPALYRDGQWTADYVRLRWIAERPPR